MCAERLVDSDYPMGYPNGVVSNRVGGTWIAMLAQRSAPASYRVGGNSGGVLSHGAHSAPDWRRV
jgi:hypothetical protein